MDLSTPSPRQHSPSTPATQAPAPQWIKSNHLIVSTPASPAISAQHLRDISPVPGGFSRVPRQFQLCTERLHSSARADKAQHPGDISLSTAAISAQLLGDISQVSRRFQPRNPAISAQYPSDVSLATPACKAQAPPTSGDISSAPQRIKPSTSAVSAQYPDINSVPPATSAQHPRRYQPSTMAISAQYSWRLHSSDPANIAQHLRRHQPGIPAHCSCQS